MERLGRGVATTVYLNFKESFWPERMAFLFHSMSSQVFWPGRNKRVLTAYFGGRTANEHLLGMSDVRDDPRKTVSSNKSSKQTEIQNKTSQPAPQRDLCLACGTWNRRQVGQL